MSRTSYERQTLLVFVETWPLTDKHYISIAETIAWTQQPLVQAGEWGLVLLLAVHMLGGLRIMALEFLPWSERQSTWMAASLAGAFVFGAAFLLSLV